MAITVEQLISKVAVVGAATYVSDMGKVTAASQNAAGKIANTFNTIGRALVSPGSLLGGAGLFGVLLGLGTQAIKASADFEDLRVTLESITQSADKAAKKLDFVRRLDIPAKAGFQKLAEAGVALESFGLRIEKVLPLVAKLQAAFPTKDIQEAVRLFGRLAQGDFPDIEALSGFGLSKAQFKMQGIRFDADGRLLSSARETLDALSRIVESKYGDILNKIAGNTSSKLASLESSWLTALRQIGNALKTVLIPILERLTGALDRINAHGGLEKWARNVIANFGKLVGAVLGLVAVFGILMATIGLITKNWMMALKGTAIAIGSLVAATYFANKFKEWTKPGYNPNTPIAPPLNNQLVPQDPNPGEGWGNTTDPMYAIARNTRQTADNTRPISDFAKQVFGGGVLGRIGVTPLELAGVRAGGGNQVTIQIYGGNPDQLQQQILSMKRRGLL